MVRTTPLRVSCPICNASVEWTAENSFKPFCSARCKQADLGAWASGDYRIAAAPQDDDFALPPDET